MSRYTPLPSGLYVPATPPPPPPIPVRTPDPVVVDALRGAGGYFMTVASAFGRCDVCSREFTSDNYDVGGFYVPDPNEPHKRGMAHACRRCADEYYFARGEEDVRGHYVVDPGGKVRRAESTADYYRWFEGSGVRPFEEGGRRVASTQLDNALGLELDVSTVFLGIDHGFDRSSEPVLFETMVFGLDSEFQWRHRTVEEARWVHDQVVACIEWEKVVRKPGMLAFGDVEDWTLTPSLPYVELKYIDLTVMMPEHCADMPLPILADYVEENPPHRLTLDGPEPVPGDLAELIADVLRRAPDRKSFGEV